MPKIKSITWKTHRDKWSTCTACDLCNTRQKVVLAKGKLPCDILFVGEAPSVSDDILGQPFVGPAGLLLMRQIEQAKTMAKKSSIRIAFTNLLSCIPIDEEGQKNSVLKKEHVVSCSPRFLEIVEIANPSTIICVGKITEKWITKFLSVEDYNFHTISHPAVILRSGIESRGLMDQKTIISIADILEDLE